MLADCLSTDRRFGLVHQSAEETEVVPGTVGCIAEILQSEELPDGRSNIVVQGADRFAFVAFVTTDEPYAVARVREYSDDMEFGGELDSLAERVRDLFEVVARAARTLADESDPIPPLPEEPALLSFTIAAAIDLESPMRQQLLVSQSPTARLRQLDQLLSPAVPSLVARAEVHKRAKHNGEGLHTQP